MGVLPAPKTPAEHDAPASVHDEPLPMYLVVAPTLSGKKADEWRFVLKTQGIVADVVRLANGAFGLLVARVHAARAQAVVRLYEEENRPVAPRTKDRPLYRASMWAAALGVALIAFFSFTGPAGAPLKARYFATGAADAAHLLHGAPWQAVTALTLHADLAHVTGNAIAGAVFLAAVHQRLGPGLGTLTVVGAGAMGNVLNALHHQLQHVGHRSIGASTAVLAAVGVLMATQLVQHKTTEGERHPLLRAAGPVFGGLALLGTVGSHPGSDLWAHLYGFVAGAVVGVLPALWLKRRGKALSNDAQAAFGFATAALFIGAWTVALRA